MSQMNSTSCKWYEKIKRITRADDIQLQDRPSELYWCKRLQDVSDVTLCVRWYPNQCCAVRCVCAHVGLCEGANLPHRLQQGEQGWPGWETVGVAGGRPGLKVADPYCRWSVEEEENMLLDHTQKLARSQGQEKRSEQHARVKYVVGEPTELCLLCTFKNTHMFTSHI